ncbi:MAG: hypothetical protein ACRC6A_09345 [Fusobacteriaceae bacterium]
METKYKKIWTLLKDWYDLGLTPVQPQDYSITVRKNGSEFCVSIPELGAYEYGSTIEECLDLHIEALEFDDDYLEACEEDTKASIC